MLPMRSSIYYTHPKKTYYNLATYHFKDIVLTQLRNKLVPAENL